MAHNAAASVARWTGILQKCRQDKNQHQAKRLHAYMQKHHLDSHPILGNHLVPALAACGFMNNALHVFHRLTCPNEHAWTALISGYASCGDSHRAFDLYHKMQQEQSVQPNIYTYLALLAACARCQDIEGGHLLHDAVIVRGLDKYLLLGSAMLGNVLVDMYGKCHLIAEAQQVFDMLPARDAVSWNSLIAGYIQHELTTEAGVCFHQMQLEGNSPDPVTFVCSLKACQTIGSLDAGRQLHAESTKRGLDTELYVGNMLVDMYSKCSMVAEAQQVFNRLPYHSAVSWSALVAGYTEQGLDDNLLSCFQQMQLEGVAVDALMFVSSLKACGHAKALGMGQRIHTEIVKRGLEKDLYVGTTLVDIYAKSRLLPEAHKTLKALLARNAASWAALIGGYAEHGFGKEAVACLQEMWVEGISADSVTLMCSLKACGTMRALEAGQELHAEIVKRGLERELKVGNTLVDMYMKCSLLAEAREVFDGLPVHDAVSWAALTAEQKCAEELGNASQQMEQEGISPDCVSFVCKLKACGTEGVSNNVQELHCELTQKGLEKQLYVGNTLVDAYGKCGFLSEACQVFEGLLTRDTVSWNALIGGKAEQGYDVEVLNCFHQMRLEGVLMDSVTFLLCLKACGNMGALETGREVHDEIRKSGLESSAFLGNILVDMYGKCGSLLEGRRVFNELPVCDVVSWNAMIKAYGENHKGSMAVECFEDMQLQGVKPNHLTFTSLLAACSHCSLVSKGQEYFGMMAAHEIEPTLEHLACMVDLFVRSGHLDEAERFITAMRCPVSSTILMTLLSACTIYGEVELGHQCFQQLVEVNEETASACLLMADIYASAGMWDDANRLEGMRKYVGASKKPGRASIELNKQFYLFGAQVIQGLEVPENSRVLSLGLKVQGYVPDVDLVALHSCDDEKFLNKYSLDSKIDESSIAFSKSHRSCHGFKSSILVNI